MVAIVFIVSEEVSRFVRLHKLSLEKGSNLTRRDKIVKAFKLLGLKLFERTSFSFTKSTCLMFYLYNE